MLREPSLEQSGVFVHIAYGIHVTAWHMLLVLLAYHFFPSTTSHASQSAPTSTRFMLYAPRLLMYHCRLRVLHRHKHVQCAKYVLFSSTYDACIGPLQSSANILLQRLFGCLHHASATRVTERRSNMLLRASVAVMVSLKFRPRPNVRPRCLSPG